MTRNAVRLPGTLTLVGSGEMSRAMSKVHRAAMSRIAGPVRAAFLDTPAGFQLNADQISTKAINYFLQHFNLSLSIASFKAASAATPTEMENTLRKLRSANYIFAGPGSPTYTIRNWQNTPILVAITQQLATGSQLVFASAAAIAVGRYALPVYEIYKVGKEPHWVEGLDLLSPYGLELAIVPHWNNTDGDAHDTRFCFMGEPRLKLLEERLPDSTIILGIDEYTACILDLGMREGTVLGAGQMIVRHKGCERYYPSGTTFKLDQLVHAAIQFETDDVCEEVTLEREQNNSLPAPAFDEALEEILSALPDGWSDWSDISDNDTASLTPLIDLIVWVRAQLRVAKQWELADEIRQRLQELGIILEDGPTNTIWRKA